MIDPSLARLAQTLIQLYQVSWSRWSSPRCLFSPSCSQRAVLIFSEKGFFRGLRLVRRQLCDCRSEYSIRFDAADRPELVTTSGRVFKWHELSDIVTQTLSVNQPTKALLGSSQHPTHSPALNRGTAAEGRPSTGQQNL